MYLNQVKALYDYTHWATDKLLETATQLNEAQLNEEMRNGIGSIRITLVHMVGAHWIWRERWQGNSPGALLNPDDFSTLEAIQLRWQEEKQRMNDLFATLRDEDLERQITYTNTRRQNLQQSLWQAMQHVVNHDTQHRSEIAMRLTELGHSPGELGMNIFFMTQS
jgi:uncharacterized damage-inducible protein DinB